MCDASAADNKLYLYVPAMMLTFAVPSHDAVVRGGGYEYLGPFPDFSVSDGVLIEVAIQRIGKTFTFSVNGNRVTDSQVPSGTTINYLGLLPGFSSTTFRIYNWTVNTCVQATPAPTTPAPTGTPAPTTPAPTNSTLILSSFVDCFVRIYAALAVSV